ncbi:MAG: hypothetical protein CM15mP32_2850 [Flavobacteriaceae bacterium]|nr:MAG: hypothetical protein CM15mP32_2850 [Flavobacteriaceae bacterium]
MYIAGSKLANGELDGLKIQLVRQKQNNLPHGKTINNIQGSLLALMMSHLDPDSNTSSRVPSVIIVFNTRYFTI